MTKESKSNLIKEFPILLPENRDMSKWAVIACDQYTTDKKYWSDLEEYIADDDSTLNLIFPEIYLSGDVENRIGSINRTMDEYLEKGVFSEHKCYVMTERTLDDGRKRIGLVACVDLEEYDFHSPVGKIRPTEETIEERLPVRIHIRENASLELPHILLLIDDAQKTVLEPLYAKRAEFNKLYDFDLNMNGGHICGYEIPYGELPINALESLLSPELQVKKYGKNAGILLAVGDGNHSMATAKKCWEKIKPTLSEKEAATHPSRYALVEILNVYDDALDFLPINRVIYGIDEQEFILGAKEYIGGTNMLTLLTPGGKREIPCSIEADKTIIGIQRYLEKLRDERGIRIEYVHEPERVKEDVREGGIGILMPYFPKNKLFDYVVNVGKLPKKAFSIGEEKTKKYYIEAKRIK